MSLLDEAMVDVRFIDKTTVPDGYGGVEPSWVEGAPFQAAIVLDSSMEARRAEKEGVKSLYTITTRKEIPLSFGEIIQRISDGQYFRITSNGNDNHTPASASLDMRQVTAEALTALPDWRNNG